jgi:hypothetical protein
MISNPILVIFVLTNEQEKQHFNERFENNEDSSYSWKLSCTIHLGKSSRAF